MLAESGMQLFQFTDVLENPIHEYSRVNLFS